MVGDQLALGGGHRVDARGDPARRAPSAGDGSAAALRAVAARAVRVGPRQRVADLVAPPPRRCAGRATSEGRTVDASSPVALAGQVDRDRFAEVDDSGIAADFRDDLVDPVVEPVAAGEDELRARRSFDVGRGAARSRGGRCSAGGSGRPRPRRRRPARDKSPIWVVVATTSSWPSAPAPELEPQPARAPTRAGRPRRATTDRRGTHPGQRATARRPAPDSEAIVAPGGAFVLTESHSPATPSSGDQRDAGELPAQQPPRQQARGDRRDDEAARSTSSAPTDRQRGDGAERDQAEQDARPGSAERRPSSRGASGSKPVASQRRPSASVAAEGGGARPPRPARCPAPSTSSRLPNSRVSTLEPEREDVAGQDHARGEAADEDERREAVVPAPARAPRAPTAGREQERRAERAERRREAEPVGEHQPGEGGGPDRVGEEGEPAQDDPGAEQAGRYGEDQISIRPRWTKGSWNGSSTGGTLPHKRD